MLRTKAMAIYTNLPVYEDSYQLLLCLVSFSRNMQRDFRYTLGEQVKNKVVEMMVLIFRANRSKDKTEHITQAREKLAEVQIVIRLLNELRQISDKQFTALVEKTVSISKQLSSWEKYTLRNNGNG